ncbi:hypothetical protein [Paenibacillus sp. FSL L8-0641]|uniref:hypothetical protein n=1 Tax=Paenibacillus sp. FSL L8-0641 TaxID=2921605 RepID=UPI0030F8C59B
MAQQPPIYPSMAVAPHGVISMHLSTYYPNNLLWPVIWYKANSYLQIDSITFEVNAKNTTNIYVSTDNPIIQEINSPTFRLDYQPANNRLSILNEFQPPNYLNSAIGPSFEKSLDFSTSRLHNTYGISTVDVDYLWANNHGVQALEVSTFFSEMYNRDRAIKLVQDFITKRASRPGAHQFALLAKAAQNVFSANMRMVFVNTVGRSTTILPNSNVIWFDLNQLQAQRMHNNQLPLNMIFEPLQTFLTRL